MGDDATAIEPEAEPVGRRTAGRPPHDHVLEIGFGPGLAIRELARRATDGFVLGIDHSEVMVRQATARNRAAVEQGRVDLRLGSALDLRDFNELFDKALAVNNFGMWPEPAARLTELRKALRPGGRVAIVSQPRCPGATAETTKRVGEETAERGSRPGEDDNAQ